MLIHVKVKSWSAKFIVPIENSCVTRMPFPQFDLILTAALGQIS